MAITSIFIVIVGEDWQNVMYMYSKVERENGSSLRTTALIFFIFCMIIGNIVLLALFTAILLHNFSMDHKAQLEK